MPPAPDRPAQLIADLGLLPHPEGGHYREWFRSPREVQAADTPDAARSALTCIDFLLQRGEHSAWHRVRSDELWHLLEGDGLRLWLMPPALDRVHTVELGPVAAGRRPREVVPAGWWQAAEPQGAWALCAATVAPGFEFADFSFGREQPEVVAALERLAPQASRLL